MAIKKFKVNASKQAKSIKSTKKSVKASSSLKVKPYVINKGQSGEYYGLKNAEDNQVLRSAPNNWKSEKGAINWAKKKGYEVVDSACGKKSVKSSKSVKKFGVKASKAAKKRVANKKITANSDSYYNEDIVMYLDGKKIFEGSIFDLREAIEPYLEDESLRLQFEDWCNQFGDPFDFDGTARDTAATFAEIVQFEAEEAPEDVDGNSELYVSGDGVHGLNFEIFYKHDEIEGTKKSIKCAQGDFTYDFSEDEFPFRVTLYYDHSQRGIADGASFNNMDEAVEYAHEKLSEGPVRIEHYDVGAVDINPDEYWENFDGEFWCTPELAEWRDEVWKSMGIGASKSIKCSDADGYADEWEDIREVASPDNYTVDYTDGSDELEYIEMFINNNYDVYLSVDHVEYRGPYDWVVDYGMTEDQCVSDFANYVDTVDPSLYSEVFDNYEEYNIYEFIFGDDVQGQFYPGNRQLDTPYIFFNEEFMAKIGLDVERFKELAARYDANRLKTFNDIQAGLEGDLVQFGQIVSGSTDITAGLSLNLNAKPNYTDWVLRGYKFDGEDVTTLRIDFQDDVKKAVMDMFSDPDIETVDLYKIPTEQETTGVFEDEEYFSTITRDDINASTDITAALNKKSDINDEQYNQALADEVADMLRADGFEDIEVSVAPEAISFFINDEVMFVQPTNMITPNMADIYDDCTELFNAVKEATTDKMWKLYDEENKAMRDAWGDPDINDSDYATRAVTLSRKAKGKDISAAEETIDIDDLDYISGDDEQEDLGYGFDSNGDPIDESTVDELCRFANEILEKSNLAKIDKYVTIDEDSFDYYMASPWVTETFIIKFDITTDNLDMMSFVLPDAEWLYAYNDYFAERVDELNFHIYVKNGEVERVELVDHTVRDIQDGKYDVEKLEAHIAELAAPVAMDIYNDTTNI